MPKLACRTCGRQLYTAVPLESLAPPERRCPRCGAYMAGERRSAERRVAERRRNPPRQPGPPAGKRDRRLAERRIGQRRRAAGDGWAAP